jgi:Arc/MetJ-type ribon-helix-helix transcriptional regulator
MKRVTVDVSEEFHHKVKVKATKEGKTISDVMRELLKRWLEEEEEKPPPPK